jgi:WD40 repeat protein
MSNSRNYYRSKKQIKMQRKGKNQKQSQDDNRQITIIKSLCYFPKVIATLISQYDYYLEGRLYKSIKYYGGTIVYIYVLPDGRIISRSDNEELNIWNPKTGKCDLTLYKCPVYAVILPKEHFTNTLSDVKLVNVFGKTIKILNLRTGIYDLILDGHTSDVSCVTILSNNSGPRLVSGSYDNTIKIWNLQTGKCDITLEGHSGYIDTIAILPDGRICSGSTDSTLKIWNVENGKCEITFTHYNAWSDFMVILSDGRIVTDTVHDELKISNPQTGKCDFTFEHHSGLISSLAALPDGRIVSGTSILKIWNPLTGKCDFTIKNSGVASNHLHIAVLPDGKLVSVLVGYDRYKNENYSVLKIWS